jgi:hypothetical protein
MALATYEMCLAAVQQNGSALQYVPAKLKTSEMHMIAILSVLDPLDFS